MPKSKNRQKRKAKPVNLATPAKPNPPAPTSRHKKWAKVVAVVASGFLPFLAIFGALATLPPRITFMTSDGKAGKNGYGQLFTLHNEGFFEAADVQVGISPCRIADVNNALHAGPNSRVGQPCLPGGLEFSSPSWTNSPIGQGGVKTIALSDVLDSQRLPSGFVASSQSLGPLKEADLYVTADYRVWILPWHFTSAARFTGTRKNESDIEWRQEPAPAPLGGFKRAAAYVGEMQVVIGSQPGPPPDFYSR
jgi:hypothetical protein